jgi:uncharacterized protein YuzE
MLRIAYDPKADAMNIRFQEGTYEISKEIAEGIIVDYTKDGRVLSIEILDASKRMPLESIKDITIGVPLSTPQQQ